MDSNSRLFRFLLLGITCFMTLGSYYCLDLPIGLQSQMQGNIYCNMNETMHNASKCCENCLGLSPNQYNILFAVRAWVAAVSVAFSGFIIDKVGNRVAGLLFSVGIVLGTSLFALASMPPLKHTEYMFPTMVLGRFLLGLTESPTRIVQDRITAYWFQGRELSMAFGITLTASRFGSVINFFATPLIAEKFGLSGALWIGVILCVVGLLSAIAVTSMDEWGVKQREGEKILKAEKNTNLCSDLRKFDTEFWLILVSLLFFYSSFMPFISDSSKFLMDMYGIEDTETASLISGAAYDISIILSPIIGFLVDRFGGRSFLSISVGAALSPCFILLAFTLIHPLPILIWMGLTYTITAVAVWSSVALLAPMEVMGLGMGLATSTQGLGVGLTSMLVGAILGETDDRPEDEMTRRWRISLIPIFINAILSSIIACVAVFIDRKRGNRLSKTMEAIKETTVEDEQQVEDQESQEENDTENIHEYESINEHEVCVSGSRTLLGSDILSINHDPRDEYIA